MEEMWLARDKDGELIMYEREPLKDKLAERWTLGGWFRFLPENWFPDVLWSDEEPTKVKLVIDNKMKYRKDKRTKNLTLRDIHVGDWVQVWSETTERYSPPLKIIQICDDGTIYLVTSDEERPTPWEVDIKNVDALPITKELLQGFGFDVVQKSYPTDEYEVFYNGNKICEFWELCDCYIIETPWDSYEYFHEFMDGMCDEFPELLRLEWKGVQ